MEIKEFVEKSAEAIEVEDASFLIPYTYFRDLEEWSPIPVMLLIAFYDEKFGKKIGFSHIRDCKTINDL